MKTPEETKKAEEIQKKSYTNATTIPNRDEEFFRAWLEVMRPLHNLANKEMDFAAAFLKKRYELTKTMTDNRLIDRVLFDVDTKKAVAESVGMSYSYMQYVFKKMRECGMIIGKSVSPKFLPAYDSGEPVRQVFIFQNYVSK